MATMNRDCRECGDPFHACGSCSSLDPEEWLYCSYSCYEIAYKKAVTKLAKEYHLTETVVCAILDTIDGLVRE